MKSPKKPYIPYGRQSIDDADISAVIDVLRGDWLTCGPAVERFEAELAKKTGSRHAISCSSGTAALHLAALALKLGPNDAVIVPTMTFLATANAARYVGSEVIFADVDPNTGLLTPDTLRQAIAANPDKNIKAVFPVHLNGQSTDMVAIKAIADEHSLSIVEDACHALGGTQITATNMHAPIGSCAMGDMTVFSFHPVKTITTGEGGAITTNDDAIAQCLRELRSHGMIRVATSLHNTDMAFDSQGEPNPWYYEMQELGYNYRASDIHCALGQSQLKKLEGFTTRRNELVALYDRMLTPLQPYAMLIDRMTKDTASWHLYVVLINFEALGLMRSDVMRKLHEHGIGTQVHYIPVHKQPYYQGLYGETDLPGATAYYNRCLSLPLFPSMSEDDVAYVADTLINILHDGRN